MASSLIPGCHVMSDLLTIREKGILFTLLEPHCKLIKTTVAQLLRAKDAEGESPGWSCLGCGAVCLIENESIHSYFLQLYCVKRAKLLWEQELFIPFKYTAARTFFHTFPADDHQVGLNFANEEEAEEFHLAVEAVQREQEKMTWMIKKTSVEREDSSKCDPPDSGIEPLDDSEEGELLTMDAPSTEEVTPTTSSFQDLDTSMRSLLMRAQLSEDDLKDKDVAEAVDCIINQFGGVNAVQRELRNRGPVSHTLPRSAGTSISLALKKGPLPPVPSVKGSTTSHKTAQRRQSLYQSPLPPWIPPPPSTPAPLAPERIRKSISFKDVGSSSAAEKSDLILTALRDIRQKQQLQRGTSEDEG
ncbi:wiskott-Aldrich syndrome protein [Sparus aurata]|uniref:wiskott-Aldrich syndrome protein n=1 Tax=Sparus aurata TaxID=8175 RepID=UPI0011C145DD|nr:wiskott-Aldrich syndrome protein-like [Sparus aurata]